MNSHRLRPVGIKGWSAMVFERNDARLEVVGLADLVDRLSGWEG